MQSKTTCEVTLGDELTSCNWCMCMSVNFLLGLVEVKRPTLDVSGTISWVRLWNVLKGKRCAGTSMNVLIYCLSSALDGGFSETSCFKFLPADNPTMKDSNMEL